MELKVGGSTVPVFASITQAIEALHQLEAAAHAGLRGDTRVHLAVYMVAGGALRFSVTRGGPGRECALADLARWQDWFDTEWILHVQR